MMPNKPNVFSLESSWVVNVVLNKLRHLKNLPLLMAGRGYKMSAKILNIAVSAHQINKAFIRHLKYSMFLYIITTIDKSD